MGWAIGWDSDHKRFVGYSVPAYCDHPGCNAEIDRGLSYVCGGAPYGGEHGCGLHFCSEHRRWSGRRRGEVELCSRCYARQEEFEPSPEHPDFMRHVLTDESWAEWRDENPATVAEFQNALGVNGGKDE